jgi:alkanesulfonate monooxygenase SsuD/methylene tetrahydromethanopterin reductase-like flavin-dependent oxidoreductase (luciferase family)
MRQNPMILTAFFFNPQGDHRMSWRDPDAPRREIFDLDYYKQLAMAAESARMDAIFVADHVAMWDTYESRRCLTKPDMMDNGAISKG